jgi:hypothetical protein
MEVPQSTCGLMVLRRLGMRISSRSKGAGGIRGEEVLDRRELPDTLGCPGRARDWAHTQESRAFCFFHFVHLAAIV